jgi:hypothetical protein
VSPAEAEKEEETVGRDAVQRVEAVQGAAGPKSRKLFGEMFSKDVRHRTLLGCFLQGMNQVCGSSFGVLVTYLFDLRRHPVLTECYMSVSLP